MTGKSDVLEAVVEWMILRVLEERGPIRRLLLTRELRRRAQGALPLTDSAISVAVQRLELSGWVLTRSSGASKEEIYRLTRSAERYMRKELEQWQFFLANSHKITALVQQFVVGEAKLNTADHGRKSA